MTDEPDPHESATEILMARVREQWEKELDESVAREILIIAWRKAIMKLLGLPLR